MEYELASRLFKSFKVPSSIKVSLPLTWSVVVPDIVPFSITCMSIVSAGTNEAAIGESVTWTQPSRTVEFPGALKPVRVVEPPEGSTVLGPAHEVVAAVVIGANIIKSTKAPASLLRSYDMYTRNITDIMN